MSAGSDATAPVAATVAVLDNTHSEIFTQKIGQTYNTHLRADMASSVAAKRLFQEYKALLTAPPDGITAGPVNEDDMFVWEALIQGPEDTPYEGGIFPAELKFPRDYPLNPPKMKFLGEIWHPNGEQGRRRPDQVTIILRLLFSVHERRSVYFDSASARGRSESLRNCSGEMVTNSIS